MAIGNRARALRGSAGLLAVLASCAPHLDWAQPIVVGDGQAPLPGVEVAIDGRFIGVTDAQGRVLARFTAPAGKQMRLEARASAADSIHLPKAVELGVPSVWTWMLGADFAGESMLPPKEVQLEAWDVAVLGEDGDSSQTDDGVAQANEEAQSSSGRRSSLPPTAWGGIEFDAPADAESRGAGQAEVGKDATQGATQSATQGATQDVLAAAHGGVGTPVAVPESGDSSDLSHSSGATATSGKASSPLVAGGGELATNGLTREGSSTALNASTVGTGGKPPNPGAQDKNVEGTRLANPNASLDATGREVSDGATMLPRPVTLIIEGFSGGTPLAGLQVYSVRRASGRIVRLGETGPDGTLSSDHPTPLLGEMLLVRHPCCVSQVRPLALDARAKEVRKLRVDLAPGTSHDFVAVQMAFGQPRALEKISFQRAGRTLDVTGPAGVSAVAAKNLEVGLVALDAVANDSLPQRKPFAVSLSSNTSPEPHRVVLSSAKPRAPQVGLVELSAGEIVHAESHLRGEPAFRRARRDFLSRFVREKALRPLIFQEVKRLAEGGGLPVEQLLRRGWDISPLAGEIDFLLALEPRGGGRGDAGRSHVTGVRARLLDAAGTVLWDEVFPYDTGSAAPEMAGQAAFEGAMRALPLEFAALGATDLPGGDGTRVELSTGGEDFARALRAGDTFAWVPVVSHGGGAGSTVASGSAAGSCEGTLQADLKNILVKGSCDATLVTGDVFRRKASQGVALAR